MGDVIIWIIVGGLVGGRLFQVLDHLPYYLTTPQEIIAIDDGAISLLGSWIGGVIGAIGAARWTGIPVWRLLDVLTPPALVGQMIGWLGGLCTGAAWGLPTGGAWGIVYWNPHDLLPPQLLGVPTQPDALDQIAGTALILASLRLGRCWFSNREGRVFLAAMGTYWGTQFVLAFARPEPLVFLGLGATQVVALAAIAILLVVAGRRAWPPRRGILTLCEVIPDA